MEKDRLIKFIKKEFVFGGHLQCLGTASIVFISLIFFNFKISWEILVITYLIFYSIYLFDRFKGIKKDYLTNEKRTEHFQKYAKKIPVLLFLSIFTCLLLLISLTNLKTIFFGISLIVFGLLYPLLFKNITKKIPLFKNIYVSLFFASLVFFPFFYFSSSILKQAVFLSLFIFIKAMLMQIFLDIKDIETDKKDKLLTLGVLIGKNKTLKTLRVLSFLSILLVFLLPPIGYILSLTLLLDLYFLKRQSYILYSSEFIFWAILILIVKIIV